MSDYEMKAKFAEQDPNQIEPEPKQDAENSSEEGNKSVSNLNIAIPEESGEESSEESDPESNKKVIPPRKPLMKRHPPANIVNKENLGQNPRSGTPTKGYPIMEKADMRPKTAFCFGLGENSARPQTAKRIIFLFFYLK